MLVFLMLVFLMIVFLMLVSSNYSFFMLIAFVGYSFFTTTLTVLARRR